MLARAINCHKGVIDYKTSELHYESITDETVAGLDGGIPGKKQSPPALGEIPHHHQFRKISNSI